jgi:hypothetical protein
MNIQYDEFHKYTERFIELPMPFLKPGIKKLAFTVDNNSIIEFGDVDYIRVYFQNLRPFDLLDILYLNTLEYHKHDITLHLIKCIETNKYGCFATVIFW